MQYNMHAKSLLATYNLQYAVAVANGYVYNISSSILTQ